MPAAGTQKAFDSDIVSHLPLLDGLGMSLDLTVLVPSTRPLFLHYRDII